MCHLFCTRSTGEAKGLVLVEINPCHSISLTCLTISSLCKEE
jgi:hypothetical protein